MYKIIMKKSALALTLILLFACSKPEKTVLGDNFTDNTSVTSVIQSPEPLISEGNTAFLSGDFEKALEYYEEGLKQNRSVAYYNMGVSYYLLQDIRKAEEYFRKAVEEDPSFDEAVMNLVAVLAEQEKSEEAEKYISRLVNKKKSARVYVDMANLSLKNGSSASAAFYYQKAMDIDSSSPYIISNYANFLISIGEFEEAEKLLASLPILDFNNLYNLAYIAYERGDKPRAYSYALKALDFDATEEGNNKLASLFSALKKYPDESSALRRLITWNPKKEYRLRLVKSYLRNWSLPAALDEANFLLRNYPKDVDVIIANYDVKIAKGETAEAGELIKKSFAESPQELMLLYQTVRHISLYDGNTEEAKKILAKAPDAPLANLARTAYHIRMRENGEAGKALAKAPENTLNDYYIYKSFLELGAGRLREAENTALKIDEERPEYFWYHFVLAWDLHKPERILELINDYRGDYIIAARFPMLGYSLTPVKEDMSFAFKFEGKGTDIASQLLYPYYVEPDEIYPFLVLGYRMLLEREGNPALKELQRSLDYSDGVRINNEGVTALLSFDYPKALQKFTEAEKVLTNDPFVQFNHGLTLYLNGAYKEAEERFKQSVRLNPYMVAAYVANGIIAQKQGNAATAQGYFGQALEMAEEYENLENKRLVLPMVSRAKYLALISLEEMEQVITSGVKDGGDNFIDAMGQIARYFVTGNLEYLDALAKTKIYHSADLAYLLHLLKAPLEKTEEKLFADRNTLMTAKYITVTRKKTFNEAFLDKYMTESPILTELVNYAILSNKEQQGLSYLQRLNYRDYRYIFQYKASMYYYMWLGGKGYINVAASSETLNYVNYYDQDVHYYRMLYYLLIGSSNNLQDSVIDYAKRYPNDYKGRLLTSMNYLDKRNIEYFLDSVALLLKDEPYIFNKMPLSISIDRF